MTSKLKSSFSQVAYIASKDFDIPYKFTFFIRLISHFQVMTLLLCDSMLLQRKDNTLSKSVGLVFSEIRSAFMLSEITSETTVRVTSYVCYLYVLSQLAVFLYVFAQLLKDQTPKLWAIKIIRFFSSFHNPIIFFPMQSLFLRLMDLNLSCNVDGSFDRSFYCDIEWIIVPCLAAVLNLIGGFLKELYCYKMLNQNKTSAAKDNFYPLIIYAQKALIIPLLYFLNGLTTLLVILNFIFCLATFYILQSRLPFYNMKVLRLETRLSSIEFVISLFMLTQIFGNKSYTLIMLLILPLTIKLSLLRLDHTIQKILRIPPKDPKKAVHLPILLENYFKNPKDLMTQKASSKGDLYACGFIQSYTENFSDLEQKDVPDKAKTQAYKLIVERLEYILRIKPRNQLLLLCLAQIYIKKLKDAPKAIYLLGRMKQQGLSIPMKNSLEDLYVELDEMYQKVSKEPKKKLSYLNYFEYREKTSKLKSLIQQEVLNQIKFWEGLNEGSVNVYSTINRTEAIDSLQDKIEALWQKEVQNLQKVYLNAPILYGIYVDIVKDLPNIGLPLIKKSYKLILGRSALQKKMMDISTGKSAIIIASSGPEHAGQIIDASSSVKKLFEIDKENLVGSNINVLLPKMMARQHDLMIQNFHKRFKYDMNTTFTSYAKSFGDQYFPVEINLHALPSLKKGLNIVAYIKKLAKSPSIIILDYSGKILECSKDLQNMLSVNGIGTFLDLGKICPGLIQANQAFNIMYSPEGYEINSPDTTSYQPLLENEPLSATTKFSETNYNNKFKEGILNSPTDVFSTRDMLLTYKDNEENLKTNLEMERSASNLMKTEDTPLLRRPKERSVVITRENAEAICNSFKEKKKLKFNLFSANSKKVEKAIFETQIEPLVFGGTLYKLVKVKKLKEIQSPERHGTQKTTLSKFVIPNAQGTKSSMLVEKYDLTSKPDLIDGRWSKKLTNSSSSQRIDSDTQSANLVSDSNFEEADKDYAKIDMELKNSSRMSKASSSIHSVKSGRYQIRQLNKIFTKQKVSNATRLAIFTVFLSVLVVIASAVVDLAFSRRSLDQMDKAVDLIDLTNSRLFRLLASWRGMLVLYSRSVKLRPDNNPAGLNNFRVVIRNNTIEMSNNNNMLRKLVDELSDEYVTRKQHEKKVALWLPYQNKMLYDAKVDLFTANQVIAGKNVFTANVPGNVVGLLNRSEVIFALNNTANEYLVKVRESIDDVKYYFDQTCENNVNLLKMILTFENLALAISFFSLGLLFRVIYTGHRNLFRVLSKINKSDIEQRVAQLKKLSSYLKENAEDAIILYQDNYTQVSNNFKVNNNEKAKKQKENSYSRDFSMKTLVWNMNKHLSFAFVMMVFIITLFWVSFFTSIKGFDNLSRISDQIITVYDYGGQISSILSSFYYAQIFITESVIKIRNDVPLNQLKISIDYLRDASDKLLETLTTPGVGIEDPEVETLLKNNLCKYVTKDNKAACDRNTNYNGFGLLGMNARYYRTCGLPILDYIAYPTTARGKKLLDTIVDILGEMHNISFDGYESLANLLVASFKAKTEDKKADSLTFFKYNLTVIIIMAILIRIIVITKYKRIDISVQIILRLIPYEITEKNKVISYYLSKKFSKELSNMNKT